MDSTVMREQKAVLTIGIICTLFFASIGIFFSIAASGFVMLLFLPFILLGCYVILMYFRHSVILETSQMIVLEPFRKNKVIRYSEIGIVLIHTINAEIEMILLNCWKERLMKFSAGMTNAEKAIDILEEREISCIDLSEMIECGHDIKEYLPALTKLERFYYCPQLRVMETARKIKTGSKGKKMEKQKRFVKIIGWVMIGMDVLAFLSLNGKIMYSCLVLVLLMGWGMYIWMYPNLFLELSQTIRIRKRVIRLPALGIGFAGIFCLLSVNIFNYDFADFLIFVGIFMIILLAPFMFKLYLIKEKPDKSRILSTIFVTFILAFAIVLPINYLTTFQSDGHESIIVNDKSMSGGKHRRYYVNANWRGDNQNFSISGSEYDEFQKGDQLRVCLRHSIFGFHYWTVHR